MNHTPEVLILGGTALARQLAAQLTEAGVTTVSSLAGRTSAPLPVAGDLRVGGFGGAEGLTAWLESHRPRCMVNASHAFATQISRHAALAAEQTNTPMARLRQPSWTRLPEASQWLWVPNNASAVRVVTALPDPVMLTVGRQATAEFLALGNRRVFHRVVEAPDGALPDRWQLIQARGPFSHADELALMSPDAGPIGALVTKDSGGARAAAKLDVAAQLGVPVVMIARPDAHPSATVSTPEFAVPQQSAEWVRELLAER